MLNDFMDLMDKIISKNADCERLFEVLENIIDELEQSISKGCEQVKILKYFHQFSLIMQLTYKTNMEAYSYCTELWDKTLNKQGGKHEND